MHIDVYLYAIDDEIDEFRGKKFFLLFFMLLDYKVKGVKKAKFIIFHNYEI